MPQEGMLIQVDGSPHPWLEERGPRFVILLAVDDATGIVAQAVFHTSEDTRGYLVLLEGLVRQWGIPLALYSDRHAAFKYNARQGPALYESTQFARVMRELGIQQIFALSPQAKGRVERMASTFQDRLVTELRLAGADSMEQANAILQEFLPLFNARFAVAAEQPEQAYRPVPEELSLTETVSIRHTRKVARDNTIKYQWRVLQLLPSKERPSYAGLRVELLERADGELMIRYQGEPIDFQEATLRSPALWGEGTGSFPSPESSEAAGGLANGHLDDDQRKLLAGLESSVRRKAKAKKATGQGRGTQGNPLRHQLHRTPIPPSRLAGKRCNRPGAKVSLSRHCPETGHVARHCRKVRQSEEPAHQTTQRQGTGQGRGPGRSPNRRRLTMVTFSLFKTGDIFAGQQHNHNLATCPISWVHLIKPTTGLAPML